MPRTLRAPGSRGRAHVAKHAAAYLEVANHALRRICPAGLELRLHEHERLPGGSGEPEQRRQRGPDRDEGDVAHDHLGREREARHVPCVDALEHRDPIVRSQPGMKLPVPDVESDHPGGAVLEQAVGEPSGRGADVEAVLARRVERRAARAHARASHRRARRIAAAVRPPGRPTRRAASPACRSRRRARRSRGPAPGCGSPQGHAPRGGHRAASSQTESRGRSVLHLRHGVARRAGRAAVARRRECDPVRRDRPRAGVVALVLRA